MSVPSSISLLILTHSEQRPQNIFSLEENPPPPPLLSNWQHIFLYFHYKSVKLMFCLDISTFGLWPILSNLKRHINIWALAILSNLKSRQFGPRIAIFNLSMCCQFEDLLIISPKIIPMSHQNIKL